MSQQQQPFNAYPYGPVMKSPPNSSHSFGPTAEAITMVAGVFLLAVAACVLNRLCGHRGSKPKVDQPPPPADNANGEKKPEEKPTVALQRADIESGFANYSHGGGGPVPPPQYGGGWGPAPPPQYGGEWGPVPPQYGGGREMVPPHFF